MTQQGQHPVAFLHNIFRFRPKVAEMAENNQQTPPRLNDELANSQEFDFGNGVEPEISLDEENEENEDLGVVDVEEGQRGKSGIGKVFIHRGIAFHTKTSKRKADGGRYLVCKTKGCGAKLMIAGDDRTVTKTVTVAEVHGMGWYVYCFK